MLVGADPGEATTLRQQQREDNGSIAPHLSTTAPGVTGSPQWRTLAQGRAGRQEIGSRIDWAETTAQGREDESNGLDEHHQPRGDSQVKGP